MGIASSPISSRPVSGEIGIIAASFFTADGDSTANAVSPIALATGTANGTSTASGLSPVLSIGTAAADSSSSFIGSFSRTNVQPQFVPQKPVYLAGTAAVFATFPKTVALTFLFGKHLFSEVKDKTSRIEVNLSEVSIKQAQPTIDIGNVKLVRIQQKEPITLLEISRETIEPKVTKRGQIVPIQK